MHKTSVLEPETEVRPFETCSFLWGSRNYLLRQPIQILSARQAGLWVFECPAYGLSAFSVSREEALSQLQEEFDFSYNGLTGEVDEPLTPDAAALRDRLRSDVLETSKSHGLETRG
jgi:hypothetical protein